MNTPRNDSLQKRYVYKLTTNLAGIAMSFVTQTIIPRGLGPGAYGDFSFLTNFFNQVTAFFDSGSSIGFYTKLSCRPHDSGLKQFYFCLAGITSLLLLLIVTGLTLSPFAGLIWPGQSALYVHLAALLAILFWLSQIMGQMTDASGLTVPSEMTRLFQKVFALILVFALFMMGWLHLTSFFLYNYAILFFLIASSIWVMRRWGQSDGNDRLSLLKVKGYARELYEYSHPLIIYSGAGLVANMLDRWLLQYFGGSIQQGFFGLSFQIGSICMAFTSAITPLLLREFSIDYESNDLAKMRLLFRRSASLLYSIAAYFSCFIALQSDKVVYIVGGDKFRDGARVVAIMALYPIHQTFGQLSSSVLYAAGQTRLYRNAGTLFLLAGLPLTYFLLAPRTLLGMNAGATGLAVKMVLLQFVSVNVLLFYNARLLKLSFIKQLAHECTVLATLLLLAGGVTFAVDVLWWSHISAIGRFLAAGFLYTSCVCTLAWLVPSLFGLTPQDLRFRLSSQHLV